MLKILSSKETEESLIQGCLRAEPKAQRRLYEKYAGRFMAICCRYVSDEMEAEDLLIEGFMKIFERLGQFKNEGSFEGWMRRVMVNECLMYLRTKKRQGYETSYEDILYEQDASDDQSSNLEAEELLKMISQLPTGYRTVFNLYAIEGYAHAEIAEMLGITESTSKSQLSRARVMLQKIIQVHTTI
jgi:RNA polymerase sigma factor (sigma-70 family)